MYIEMKKFLCHLVKSIILRRFSIGDVVESGMVASKVEAGCCLKKSEAAPFITLFSLVLFLFAKGMRFARDLFGLQLRLEEALRIW